MHWESTYAQKSSRIELQQLKYFVAVAEELNFSRAAEKLYVTQSLLSQQMSALEKILNKKLLIRNTKYVELTIPGKTFLNEAKKIIKLADDAIDYAKKAAEDSASHPTLKISCESLFNRSVVNDSLFKFKEDHPNVDFQIYIEPYFDVWASVSNFTKDLGFFLFNYL